MEATRFDLASDTSKRICPKKRTAKRVAAATEVWARMPRAAMVKSSTYSATMAAGHQCAMVTTISSSSTRSSVVANVEPAVMPRVACRPTA